jgi:pimeloyl-ACP methyl ester carboxylesterase
MLSIIDRTISLEGLIFHYRQAGGPTAPPLVLLHALGVDAQDWDEVMLSLAERYHVFALDQRGHGQSARPESYSFEAMRDDLKAFVDALAIEKFTLVGHSMGGTVALLFAEKWPERIVRLVSEDTPPPFVTTDDAARRFPEPPDEPPQPVPYDWRLVKPIVHQLSSPDPAWWNDLPTISAPTLIIGGGSNSHVPQDKLAEVARLIPNCRFASIEGAGHTVHRNRPAEFLAIVRDFLAQPATS